MRIGTFQSGHDLSLVGTASGRRIAIDSVVKVLCSGIRSFQTLVPIQSVKGFLIAAPEKCERSAMGSTSPGRSHSALHLNSAELCNIGFLRSVLRSFALAPLQFGPYHTARVSAGHSRRLRCLHFSIWQRSFTSGNFWRSFYLSLLVSIWPRALPVGTRLLRY